jgi:hypothetical protein
MTFWGAGLQPAKPEGYESDYINADVLVTRMSADSSGNLILPDGMSYSVLVLPGINQMTLPVLKKIKELVNKGVTIVGPKPFATPGLTNYPASEQELNNLATEIWGDLDGVSRTRRSFGKGKVIWGMPLDKVMSSLKINPDITYSKPLDGGLSWIHRKDGETDIYFLVNRSDSPQDYTIRFRVSGKEPELWHPDNGSTEPASYTIKDDKTIIILHLEERESVFVLFNKKTNVLFRNVPLPQYQELMNISGAWKVSFPEKSGAPADIILDSLSSWITNSNEGIKYFSGTASYSKSFQLKKEPVRSKVFLDLGKVGDIAEVALNGKKLDILWKVPYRIDVTNILLKGKNQLEIKVTNEWTNRLIGDKEAPADKKVLPFYINPFGGQYQLTASGLMGPVKLLTLIDQTKKQE